KNRGYCRHPLAFLVEAADDICYTLIDFEDGINLGWIEEEFALQYLIKLVKENINKTKYASLTKAADRLAYLRSLAINTLINEAVAIFVENEETVLKGEFPVPLLAKSRYSAQIEDIIKISREKVYENPQVIEMEVAGYTVLSALLDAYCTAFENNQNGHPGHHDTLLIKQVGQRPKTESAYAYLMQVCHHISNMTDGNSIAIFKKLKGLL
ncbi:MAG: dGTPase, partial [Marinirhabdus sp.]